MKTVKSILLKSYSLFGKIVPSFYYPYRFAGGRIYLDITEWPTMLARVLGRFEVAKHKAIKTFLKSGGTFIDVGVNKGDFSLVAAKLVGTNGKVIAFEPEPTNCKWIKKSIEINGYKNVTLYEIALSNQDSEAQLYIGEKSGWHSLITPQKSSNRRMINVRTKKLDSFLGEISFTDPIDVIKIDVEGAELQVLHGATNTLSRNKKLVILIDIHPQLGVKPKEICDFLIEKGFSLFHEKPPFSSPVTNSEKLISLVAIKP